MSEIKLLAIDMDGTLLRNDKSISDADLTAVKRAANRGIEIIAASGRPLIMLPKDILDLGLNYAITANGARVVDLRTRRIIYHQSMDKEMARRFLEALEGMDIWIGFESGDDFYYSGRNINDIAIRFPMIRNHRGRYVRNLYTLLDKENFSLEKIAIRTLEENEPKVLQLQGEFIGLNVMDTAEGALEVNDRMSSKGAALKWLCRRLGIKRENVAAIGDSDNDLTMLSFAGHSFAMANASEFVRQICDVTVASNNENGVAEAIDMILNS